MSSSAFSGAFQRRSTALRPLTRAAMAGVSLAALTLGMAPLIGAPAQAQDTRTVINGAGGGGIILLNSTTAGELGTQLPDATDGILASGGLAAIDGDTGAAVDMSQLLVDGIVEGTTGNYTISDKIFTNFITVGGEGSGGGGGLGGVVFVNSGVNLTINNTDFTRNTVIGGEGGSAAAVSLGQTQVSLGDIELPLHEITTYYFDPTLSAGGSSLSSITLTSPNRALQPGMRITIPGVAAPVTITGVSANHKTLSFAPVTLPASLSVPVAMGLSGIDDSEFTYFIAPPPGLEVGALLVVGGVNTGVRVKSISGNTVAFDKDIPADIYAEIDNNAPTLSYLNLVKADISQIKSVDTGSNRITVAGNASYFRSGMTLTGGELGTGNVTITNVEVVDVGGGVLETRLTLSAPPPTTLTHFDSLYEQATIGSNELQLTNSRLYVGMKVSGPGLSGDVFIGSISNGVVTLVDENGADVPITVKPELLTFSGVASVSGAEVTLVNSDLLIGVSEGMLVSGPGIPAGTTVESIDGSTVTLSLPDGSSLGTLGVLTFASDTALGGTMNGIEQTVTGGAGRNGNSGVPSNTIWGDGEGNDGKMGDSAENGTLGAGGTGGTGGDGSSSLSWSPAQVKAVIDSALDAGFLTAETAAALASVPPDVFESVATALQAAAAYVNLGFEIGQLVEWHAMYAAGDNAGGGNGGAGGWGGNGSDFFGGGVGGAGGNGGDAANSTNGDGGDGGDGGWGGIGGFGGGGGMGGAGGEYGDGVSVATGFGGKGGKGGFGGGDGSNGDGEFGEGGAGFGGAIFVRSGGSLLITGNSIFNENRSEGGSSNNGGAAGNAAGADLFMLKGSTVVIRPGATGGVDNVVVFNGTIGDDSRESYDEATNARGFGAGLTIGKGMTIFNGANTYTGQTRMEGGVLEADDGVGLNHHSNLNFNGSARTGSLLENTNAGVLMSSGYFGRQLGTVGTHVQWTGSGGFAAVGGDLTVNIGNLPNPQRLVWGSTPGFFRDGNTPVVDAALVFGSEHADSVVRWLNPIELGNLRRQIVVADNDGSNGDFAVMQGAISGSGDLLVGELGSTFWDGTLVLTGKNTFTGDLKIQSGAVAVAGEGELATGVDVEIATGAEFHVMAADLELGIITNAGAVTVGEDLKAYGIDNTGSIVMLADIDLSPGFPFADNPATYPEPNVYGDFYHHGATAALWVSTDAATTTPPSPADPAHTLTVDRFYGDGVVLLGDPVADVNAGPAPGADAPILTIAQRGTSQFDGQIIGAGGLTLTAPAGSINPASTLTLTNENTYAGATVIDTPSTLALSGNGSIAISESVQVDGTLDISAVTTTASVGSAGPQGTRINDLSGAGSGSVVLGDKLLMVDNAASTFAGVISGIGDFAVLDGTQTLTGINTYSGETYVLTDGTLKLAASDPLDPLSPDGSIEESVHVVVEGTLDISETNDGASIKGLEGGLTGAKVILGDERLTISDANAFDAVATDVGTSFAGVISGEGGVSVTGGRQTLTNANTYTGTTIVGPDGELYLAGSGAIASSESVTVDGVFDISGTTAGAEIIKLLGTATDALIQLGSKTLTLTGNGDSSYAGVIVGTASSGLTVDDGTLTLTGGSPNFLGKALIAEDATLFLAAGGSITGATVEVAGTFDISGITPGGTSVDDLYGDGTIALDDKVLTVTDASGGTFSGPITGTGAFGVAGGLLNLDFPTDQEINAQIFAQTGGTVLLEGGIIDTTGSDQAALRVINGGTIEVLNTRLVTPSNHPTAAVSFDDSFVVADNPARVRLGAGTVLENDGPLLVVTRDGTSPTGNAFDGNVTFIIDNAGTVVGDILDEGAVRTPAMGSTTVYLGDGVDWTGRAVAGDFLVNGGASAHFNPNSLLDNLYAGTGAQVDLSGNVVILGRFTIDSNGIVAPGSSPGAYNPGQMESNNGNETLWIEFGNANPEAGDGKDYSQINVAGDFTGLSGTGPGVLAITLERWNSTQDTPLGNLAALELLKIGGTENPGSNVYLAERFTQYGHELLLDRRVRTVDPTAIVAGTEVIDSPTEDLYFADDSLVVYGLRAIVQDETYGLATLTGTIHQGGADTFGTFLERRGTDELESTWGRAGVNHTEVTDTVNNTTDLAFGQYGVDIVQLGDLRAGVMGSYAYSKSGVGTETGTADLTGTTYTGGAYATWANGGAYLDAVGLYGFGDWTFSPTSASALTINSQTATAAVEAGFRLGDDGASITPWSQLLYQATFYNGLDSAWVEGAEFVEYGSLTVRGGVRAEAQFGIFAPYVDLSMTHNLNDQKTVAVDGFDFTTGMGGTKVELGAGFEADLSETATAWTQVKGAYGEGETGKIVGYQGQAGVHISW